LSSFSVYVFLYIVSRDYRQTTSVSTYSINFPIDGLITVKNSCRTCGYRHWWFGSAFEADSLFGSQSLLCCSGCSYWCI